MTPHTSDTNCMFGDFLEPPSGLIVYQESQNTLKAIVLTFAVYYWKSTHIKID